MKPFLLIAQVLMLALCHQYCFGQDKKEEAPPLPPTSIASITHGPVIGGVTNRSARIYLRTSEPAEIHFLLYNDDNSLAASPTVYTKAEKDTSEIFDLNNLMADQGYRYEIFIKGRKQREGSFHTFVSPGETKPFAFTLGSCMEHNYTDSIFVEISKHKPAFFLHLGDWTYPDHEFYPKDTIGGNNQFYSLDYAKVQQAYRIRYSLPNMNKFMANTPMDFVYDDDDFVFDGNSRETQSGAEFKGKKTILTEKPLPPNSRHNAIKGYLEYFPHYPIAHDTSNGVYHSFRYGNVEVFFLDSRANRSPESEAFKVKKNGKLVFAPNENHTILGKEQMEWLLNGLQNSTADWKFIVTGTNFNMGYRRAIDLALLQQNRQISPGRTGASLAASMAAMWVGYPHDQAKLINYCADNKIKNVVILSGDAHSSCIDDGANAGLPELVASNLGVPNTKIPSLLYNRVGLDLWNVGAQGVGNDNYNNCFGKVEIFGTDSVKLNVIDQYGTIVTSCSLQNGIVAKHVELRDMKGNTAKTRHRRRQDLFRLIGKTMKKDKKVSVN